MPDSIEQSVHAALVQPYLPGGSGLWPREFWRARCSCGWLSGVYQRLDLAEAHGERHTSHGTVDR